MSLDSEDKATGICVQRNLYVERKFLKQPLQDDAIDFVSFYLKLLRILLHPLPQNYIKKFNGEEAGAPNLFLCDTCGRHFALEALARHNPICKKVFNKKRKPFNSSKQRLQGTDIQTVKKKPPAKNGREKKSNWRQQHEDFISAIRAAKLATQAMKEGRPLPPPPPPSINPDYIQCPYCMRRFNQTAAERHINFCKEQAARRPFAQSQKGGKPASGKQGVSKKEPTLTNAVGTLLQNRLQGTNTGPSVTGHGIEISTAAVHKKISPISSGTESGVSTQGRR